MEKIEELFGKVLKNSLNEEVDIEKLEEVQFFGIYFTANFCNPSVKFKEILENFYNEINRDGYKFEII